MRLYYTRTQTEQEAMHSPAWVRVCVCACAYDCVSDLQHPQEHVVYPGATLIHSNRPLTSGWWWAVRSAIGSGTCVAPAAIGQLWWVYINWFASLFILGDAAETTFGFVAFGSKLGIAPFLPFGPVEHMAFCDGDWTGTKGLCLAAVNDNLFVLAHTQCGMHLKWESYGFLSEGWHPYWK